MAGVAGYGRVNARAMIEHILENFNKFDEAAPKNWGQTRGVALHFDLVPLGALCGGANYFRLVAWQ